MKTCIINFFTKTIVFLIAICCSNSLIAQDQIVQVGAGEYSTVFRTNKGRLFTALFTGTTYKMTDMGLSNIIDVEGAQYTNIALDNLGKVYIAGINSTTGLIFATTVPFDSAGNSFRGNSKVYGWYQAYLSIKNGTIWTWGQDMLNINGGANIPAPRQLINPSNKVFTKLVVSTQNEYALLALASDGTVWKYISGTASSPTKIHLSARARNIAAVGAAAYIVETDNDLLAWGSYASYVGGKDRSTVPVSIKSKWTSAGCVFPAKELMGNYNTLHIIDQNNNMFGSGCNLQGEVGNGKEYPDWQMRKPDPWQWNFTNGQMITAPVQIPGKFKNINTSNTVTFYHFVQDMGGNWYSWGRNKGRSLGNGITLNVNDEAIYPEFGNVPAPALVKPFTQRWKIVSFNPNATQAPLANAGIYQYISSASATLYGQGSSQQHGNIIKYAWSKVSGAGTTIISPSLMNTKVTGLSNGTFVFRLVVTNSNGAQAESEVKLIVFASDATKH